VNGTRKNIELPFFNYYLKDKGNAQNIAEATIFFTGENKWHMLQQWPPQNIEQKELFFSKDQSCRGNYPI
jgi:predicted acyl esterase